MITVQTLSIFRVPDKIRLTVLFFSVKLNLERMGLM